MTAAADFAGDYAPGGLSSRSRARASGRRGGLASGVKRRQLAVGRRPRCSSRAAALALAYRHRQLPRDRFDQLYGQQWPRPERPSAAVAWEKGRETLWEHYASIFTVYRVSGQHARTTNGQRAAALTSRGRPRCRRTIQRLHRKLEELGLAHVSHFKNQRSRPGHKDCLVLEIRTPLRSRMSPRPFGAVGTDPFGSEVPTADPERETETRPQTALSPAASPPDEAAASPPASEIGELEAAVAFQQLKLDSGWATPGVTCEIRRLRCLLRATRGIADDQSPPRGSRPVPELT